MSTTDVIDDTSHIPADLVPVMEALARVGRDLCRTIKRGPLGGNALGAKASARTSAATSRRRST
jgi:hypothetical protein